MGYHAKRSPSSAHRWTSCTASIAAQEGKTDNGNDDARNGTCCHQMSAECLEHGTPDASGYLDRVLVFWDHPESGSHGEIWQDEISDAMALQCNFLHEVPVTQKMVDAVDSYVAYIRKLRDDMGATLYVEQRVPIGHITLEEPGVLDENGRPIVPSGTSDTIFIAAPRLVIADAKFGRQIVMAYDVMEAESMDPITCEPIPPKLRMNLQLALYALGSLHEWELLYDFETVTAIIVQPFLDHISEYTCTVQELRELGEWIKSRAVLIDTDPQFDPSEDNCHYCRAAGQCEAQDNAVAQLVFHEYMDRIDLDTAKPVKPVVDNKLGSRYAAIPMVEEWIKATHRLMRKELDEGRPVMRNDGRFYHMVAGRASARKWNDPAAAEQALRDAGVPEDKLYERKLISPTTVEEMATPKRKGPAPLLNSEQWANIQATLISQTPGEQNPVIALSTDPRPPLPTATDGFDYVDIPADIADLL